MEDLTGRLSEILNSPEGMEQMKAIAGMLGMSGGLPGAADPPPAVPAAPSSGSDIMGGLLKFAPLLGHLQATMKPSGFSTHSARFSEKNAKKSSMKPLKFCGCSGFFPF